MTSAGGVVSLHIAPGAGDEMRALTEVLAVVGRGIEGDRYFNRTGTYSTHPGSGRAITLIEMEAIEFMRDGEGIDITPMQTRRNILTRGISLNDLVGQDFFVGNVQLHGVRLCEPCQYLASRTDQRILQSMVHRGGLRADIITEGTIHINDLITSPG